VLRLRYGRGGHSIVRGHGENLVLATRDRPPRVGDHDGAVDVAAVQCGLPVHLPGERGGLTGRVRAQERAHGQAGQHRLAPCCPASGNTPAIAQIVIFMTRWTSARRSVASLDPGRHRPAARSTAAQDDPITGFAPESVTLASDSRGLAHLSLAPSFSLALADLAGLLLRRREHKPLRSGRFSHEIVKHPPHQPQGRYLSFSSAAFRLKISLRCVTASARCVGTGGIIGITSVSPRHVRLREQGKVEGPTAWVSAQGYRPESPGAIR
jgi:hypothetical protein